MKTIAICRAVGVWTEESPMSHAGPFDQNKESNMKIRSVCGMVLGSLMTFSAILAILGIWGAVDGDTVWKLLGTFGVVGMTTLGVSYVANSFFGAVKEEPKA